MAVTIIILLCWSLSSWLPFVSCVGIQTALHSLRTHWPVAALQQLLSQAGATSPMALSNMEILLLVPNLESFGFILIRQHAPS